MGKKSKHFLYCQIRKYSFLKNLIPHSEFLSMDCLLLPICMFDEKALTTDKQNEIKILIWQCFIVKQTKTPSQPLDTVFFEFATSIESSCVSACKSANLAAKSILLSFISVSTYKTKETYRLILSPMADISTISGWK